MATKKTETVEEKTVSANEKALQDEIAALKAQLEKLQTKPAAEEAAKATGSKMVKVRIPRIKADQEDVFVSVNLRSYIIKRGVEVEVPDFVAEVLRHQEEMLEEIMIFEEAAQNKHK